MLPSNTEHGHATLNLKPGVGSSPAGSAEAFYGCAGGRYRPGTGNTDSPERNKVRERSHKSSNPVYSLPLLEASTSKHSTVITKDLQSLNFPVFS